MIGYTEGKDWRDKLDDAGMEGMRLMYPYMEPDEATEPRIRYFSLLESYGALIHLVCSDGKHKEIRLENGKLPESYNQFRKELWDYFIPYIYRKEYQDVKELYGQGKDGGKEHPRYDEYFIQQYMEEEVLGGYREVEELGWEAYLEREDWRNHIDDWGQKYMLQKYPYMVPAAEQESG